ncbi:MAG: pyridoxamine 5'-phosphate oxidase family protein [Clostridia bacterium]
MNKRFGHDTLLSMATICESKPVVRIVNSYYENGAFYVVTYLLSNKMKQIKSNPAVAVCGEWFTANGIGENLGWVLEEKNSEIMSKLRIAFAEWYDNGHTDESDKNTCLLKIRLIDGVLFNQGTKYEINFTNK